MSFAQTWQNADPEKTGGGTDNPPADGKHQVVLTDGGAWVAKSGNETVKLELSTVDGQHEWAVIHGFRDQTAANHTAKMFESLGVDFKQLRSLEQMDATIKQLAGRYFAVTVKRNGEYVNTYIDGPAQAAAQASGPLVPPAPAAAAGAASVAPVADGDIPFRWDEAPGYEERRAHASRW